MRRLSLIVIFSIFYLSSCKKKEEIPHDFSGNYVSGGVASVTRTQMFAYNKVITNRSAIDDFFNNNSSGSIGNVTERIPDARFHLLLRIEENKKAKVDLAYGGWHNTRNDLKFDGNMEINKDKVIIR
ncbi:MAG: hypothetical protein V4663_05025 [Bacteroidota bacterium]